MGANIDVYLDCSSFYSLMCMSYLNKQKHLLAQYDVTIDYHPIFLGGVNVGSGNKPPWSLPAKAVYGGFDGARAKKYHGFPQFTTPSFFPPLTLLPQRALCFIKSHYPTEQYEATMFHLFKSMWLDSINITIPADFASSLAKTDFYSEQEIKAIIQKAGEKEWKDKLLTNTQKVLDQGAFGAPWMWVRNEQGKEEPFFGSDRFHFMWEFLGLPWKDIEILPKVGNKARL